MAEDFQLPSELLDDGFFNEFFVDREGKHEEEEGSNMGGRTFLSGGDKTRDLLNRAAGKGAARSDLDDAERRRRSHHERWLLNLQLLHLKQQQLLQQQLHARRGLSYGGSGTPGSSPSLRTPLLLRHHPLSQSGTPAVFLCRSSARNESAGTGVFLPRTAVSKAEPEKKPTASSTVFIPARVAQALNLNTSLPSGFVTQYG
ncbi:uncharacterized protein LOC121991505 [Zingiber officinale]|uniref:uncharacterized protein LOC121991505 n=1 Tax=Zingiber officinale TaxID=94328 RepID=UPI001C4AA46D|nr:uncharacterized protein LOC121991505 [Zingiber officinale]